MSFVFENHKISTEAYQFIADKVYQHSRIRLGNDKQALVSGRLAKRLRQLNLDSFESYCEVLASAKGQEEIGPLVDLISTNHTHFFREIEHINFLRDHMLPHWVPQLSAKRETFRFWSAASSSGEEPYTVAIVLAEYARLHGAYNWQIEGSDISSRILARAATAIYEGQRLQLPTPDLLQRYFQKGTGDYAGQYRVKDILTKQVKFHRLNLLQAQYPVAPNQHVIFCRNVMIYFDGPTQQELVMKLINQLAPGGFFVVGHSESLLGIKHPLKTLKPGIYQKV
ncbi:MAG: protein-glutamate O-methyltransferase CheR [Verrucomicrobiota bacterium]